MAEHVVVMTRKGQITVPAALRKRLGLRQGDHLALSLGKHGTEIIVRRVHSSPVAATYGQVKTGPRPADLSALREQVADEVGLTVAAEGLSATTRP